MNRKGRDDSEGQLLKFPCPYFLKVIGKNTNQFYSVVGSIIERHVPETESISYAGRTSSGDKYLAITATFKAESQEQLSEIYAALNRHDLVLLTL
jgi:putative lipoic acid-binding regulatory protein